MPALPLIAAGLQVAGGLAGNILGAGSVRRNNERQERFAWDMYNRQRSDSLADWTMQTEYNSPANVMKRYKEAGLNPHLIYGSGTDVSASTPRSASGGGFDPQPYQPDTTWLSGSLGSFYDVQLKQQQLDNLKAQNTLLIKQAAYTSANTLNALANTDKSRAMLKKIGVDTEASGFNLAYKQAIADTQISAAKQDLKLREQKFDLNQKQYNLAESNVLSQIALRSSSMSEIASRIESLRVGRDLTRQQIQESKARVENLRKDGVLKQLDINLKRIGIQPKDPAFVRLATQIFGIGAPEKVLLGEANGKHAGADWVPWIDNKGRRIGYWNRKTNVYERD